MRAPSYVLPPGFSEELRETFEVRVQRWWPDVEAGLAGVYPPERVAAVGSRLLQAAADAFVERDPELRRLDLERTLRPDWFQEPSMIGYAAYTERFAGDLAGIASRLGHLESLGVRYLHLMPLLLPREGDSDGGYAVRDYRRVRPDLGTVEDVRDLATTLRRRGISLVLDLVLNHVAREHEWAVRARAGEQRYRDYFYVYPDREVPDAFERTLPEVFPDFAPGNFTHEPDLDGWVWTTFNSFQWDVNWSNPDVLAEYVDIVLFLANLGVEVLRLDAIAFLWKRIGTTSQNLPEVHSITQVLRAVARIACPAVILKAEAIVAPNDLVHYLGRGRHTGRVSDLAYHNVLMVQIWSMLAAQDVRLASSTLRALPPVPSTTAWITYVRCHDDIGWAVTDEDAGALGLSGFAHRGFLSDWYSGSFPGSPARGLVFQENPATGDRRISGTTAALAGLTAATEAHDDGDRRAGEDAGVRRVLLAHSLVLAWGGIPVLWSGDEVASLGQADWAAEPGHENDNRWAHRPRLEDSALAEAADPETVPGRVLAGLRHLTATRARLPHLHAGVQAEVLEPSDPGILVVRRRHPLGDLLVLANVAPQWRSFPGSRLAQLNLLDSVDALTGSAVPLGGDGNVWLPPWGTVWLVGSAR
ncbi:amylosucrase [Kineococcus gynurae]|uniref:Amylosucrase n=1 Tax=Kineococcus gynurae TaxID=452979 RepID=A0ABV5LP61_9ACTN